MVEHELKRAQGANLRTLETRSKEFTREEQFYLLNVYALIQAFDGVTFDRKSFAAHVTLTQLKENVGTLLRVMEQAQTHSDPAALRFFWKKRDEARVLYQMMLAAYLRD